MKKLITVLTSDRICERSPVSYPALQFRCCVYFPTSNEARLTLQQRCDFLQNICQPDSHQLQLLMKCLGLVRALLKWRSFPLISRRVFFPPTLISSGIWSAAGCSNLRLDIMDLRIWMCALWFRRLQDGVFCFMLTLACYHARTTICQRYFKKLNIFWFLWLFIAPVFNNSSWYPKCSPSLCLDRESLNFTAVKS